MLFAGSLSPFGCAPPVQRPSAWLRSLPKLRSSFRRQIFHLTSPCSAMHQKVGKSMDVCGWRDSNLMGDTTDFVIFRMTFSLNVWKRSTNQWLWVLCHEPARCVHRRSQRDDREVGQQHNALGIEGFARDCLSEHLESECPDVCGGDEHKRVGQCPGFHFMLIPPNSK